VTVRLEPAGTLVAEGVITVVVDVGPCSTTTDDVLPFQLASPEYTAVSVCVVAAGRITPASTALPPLTVAVPSVEVPSKNVTVPVMAEAIELPVAPTTVAVSVSGTELFTTVEDAVSVVVVFPLPTVTVTGADVDP
jgi:hypothetical protein